MSILTMTISKIKGIDKLSIEFPIEAGIYALVGSNGCGKSTILQCLAQLICPKNALWSLKENDYSEYSEVIFKYGSIEDEWYVKQTKDTRFWKNAHYDSDRKRRDTPNNIAINGMYEGSLFVGTRFQDSRRIDELVYSGKLAENDIMEADEYVKGKLSYILHGDYEHYQKLKRLKNRELRETLKLISMPYFIGSIYGGIIS